MDRGRVLVKLRERSARPEGWGFTAQPKILAQRMGVKESEVREMQERMAQSEISLDQPTGGEGNEDGAPLREAMPDSWGDPEGTTPRAEWRDFATEKVEQCGGTVKATELEIFRIRLVADY